jgi:hypothetical protein
MSNKNKIEINYVSAIIAAIVAIIVFCITAVVFNVIALDVLPANFIGAALGALIGALITLILLRGQTDIEEKKGKDIRILKMKIKVFQNFINAAWKVWEDQVISIKEFEDLTSSYYKDLMIYLDENKVKKIGNELTAMGDKIDKTNFNDARELRQNIVNIINTLSKEINLGGEIDTRIMEKHDEIVFPIFFKKMLLNRLNNVLNENNNSNFKEGRYEFIWEGINREFITFELRKFAGIKLAMGHIGASELKMIFMADRKIVQLDEFRHNGYKGVFRQRFGDQPILNNPIPDDEDKTPIRVPLDFSNKDSMKVFREEKRNFADVLSKRVLYHLAEWNIDGLGIIDFLEKHLGQEAAG